MAFVTPSVTASSTFVPSARAALSPLRASPRAVAAARRTQAQAPLHKRPTAPRMGLGEDGLKEDLEFAQNCLDDGCTVDAVQSVLTRLERRRAVLALELAEIERVMADLVRSNEGDDRGIVAEAMAAAVSIFSKAGDDYPSVGGSTNAWSLDPLKKQPKL